MTQTIIRKKAVSTEKYIIVACAVCGTKDRLLETVQGKKVCGFCKPLMIEVNPVYRFLGKVVNVVESAVNHVNEALATNPLVMWACKDIISKAFANVKVFQDVTTRDIRLYLVEGIHLSKKGGDVEGKTRLTWYTNVELAKEMAIHTPNTGRYVYIDLSISCCSPYSHRFYKRDYEGYVLHDELARLSRRKWKYYKEGV